MNKALLAGLLAISTVAFAGSGNSKDKTKAAAKPVKAATRPASCNPADCKLGLPLCIPGIPYTPGAAMPGTCRPAPPAPSKPGEGC